MEKDEKILVASLISLVIVGSLVIIYMNYSIGNPIFPEKIEKEIEFTRVVNVDKLALFETMADISNYPKIFPNNIISIIIINQSENVIFAKETISELGITTDIIAKHMLFPPDKHIVTIVDGDAKNSTITIMLHELNSSTKLTTKIELELRGVLIPFGFLPQNQFEHAMITVISQFVDYTNKIPSN